MKDCCFHDLLFFLSSFLIFWASHINCFILLCKTILVDNSLCQSFLINEKLILFDGVICIFVIWQGQECFNCKGLGHIAKKCPNKIEENLLTSNICLRCGDSGHDMWTCNSDYSHDDLKVCITFGTLFSQHVFYLEPSPLFCFRLLSCN